MDGRERYARTLSDTTNMYATRTRTFRTSRDRGRARSANAKRPARAPAWPPLCHPARAPGRAPRRVHPPLHAAMGAESRTHAQAATIQCMRIVRAAHLGRTQYGHGGGCSRSSGTTAAIWVPRTLGAMGVRPAGQEPGGVEQGTECEGRKRGASNSGRERGRAASEAVAELARTWARPEAIERSKHAEGRRGWPSQRAGSRGCRKAAHGRGSRQARRAPERERGAAVHRHTSIRVHPADRLSIRAGQQQRYAGTCGGTGHSSSRSGASRARGDYGHTDAERLSEDGRALGQAPRMEALRLGTDARYHRVCPSRFGFRARARRSGREARAEGVRVMPPRSRVRLEDACCADATTVRAAPRREAARDG